MVRPAWRKPSRIAPDLILMDIQLPVLDRYEATGRIKTDPSLKATPVIAVSSFAMKGDEEKARAAGCDHYVTKPYSPPAVAHHPRLPPGAVRKLQK
jgi:CheY-like chemotaxis protein